MDTINPEKGSQYMIYYCFVGKTQVHSNRSQFLPSPYLTSRITNNNCYQNRYPQAQSRCYSFHTFSGLIFPPEPYFGTQNVEIR